MGWLGDSSHRGQGCQAWTAADCHCQQMFPQQHPEVHAYFAANLVQLQMSTSKRYQQLQLKCDGVKYHCDTSGGRDVAVFCLSSGETTAKTKFREDRDPFVLETDFTTSATLANVSGLRLRNDPWVIFYTHSTQTLAKTANTGWFSLTKTAKNKKIIKTKARVKQENGKWLKTKREKSADYNTTVLVKHDRNHATEIRAGMCVFMS